MLANSMASLITTTGGLAVAEKEGNAKKLGLKVPRGAPGYLLHRGKPQP